MSLITQVKKIYFTFIHLIDLTLKLKELIMINLWNSPNLSFEYQKEFWWFIRSESGFQTSQNKFFYSRSEPRKLLSALIKIFSKSMSKNRLGKLKKKRLIKEEEKVDHLDQSPTDHDPVKEIKRLTSTGLGGTIYVIASDDLCLRLMNGVTKRWMIF